MTETKFEFWAKLKLEYDFGDAKIDPELRPEVEKALIHLIQQGKFKFVWGTVDPAKGTDRRIPKKPVKEKDTKQGKVIEI